MSRKIWARGWLLGVVAALAACRPPDTAFHASPDGGGDTITNVLAIVTSAHTLDVDEGKTVDFTVALSQPPAAQLIVKIAPADSAAAAKLGISAPELRFQPSSFDQPQTITITGLPDADAANALASISISADTLDTVSVGVTVHDPDLVEIATDIATSAILGVNEAATSTVRVHLTHQPAGDVRIKAVLGLGPVTVTPAERTFTAANYDVDQVFAFAAPDDINASNEDQSLTFQATGLPDRLYTIHDIDNDTLNISATPSSLAVNEGGTKALNVSLTYQPAANVTVHVALQRGNVTIDATDLSFTPQNFDRVQVITVGAPQDANTTSESDQITLSIPAIASVSPVTIGVSTIDDDVQTILQDAPNPLSVGEDQTATFGVTLKFQPTTNVTVVVSSLDGNVATATPGTLTFTPVNYADPAMHRVTVRGSHDTNLATNSTSIKLHEPTLVDVLAPVNVTDVDRQAIVLSTTTLSIAEGQAGSFFVSLAFDPGTTTAVTVASNSAALPVDTGSITFTGGPTGNWATPVKVTVNPPIDTNNVSEVATITVSGGGAATTATVMATATDATVVQTWGWPSVPLPQTPFPGTFTIPAGFVFAYKVNVGAVATLATFHAHVPAAAGTYTMALYTDAANAPGSLVANGKMLLPKTLSNGANTSDPIAMPPVLNAPAYWLAIRFSQTVSISYGGGAAAGRQCRRNVNVDISLDWPTNFASATCTDDNLFNIWITTFHQ